MSKYTPRFHAKRRYNETPFEFKTKPPKVNDNDQKNTSTDITHLNSGLTFSNDRGHYFSDTNHYIPFTYNDYIVLDSFDHCVYYLVEYVEKKVEEEEVII